MLSDRNKTLVVVFLGILCVVLAYFLLFSKSLSFVPSSQITSREFASVFQNSSKVVILMDVRSVSDDTLRSNILQCGVDFAGSSGFGGKSVSYRSIDDSECVTDLGRFDRSFCFSDLSSSLTIYIQQGNSTSFYSNGMVVGVGKSYPVGSCAIHATRS